MIIFRRGIIITSFIAVISAMGALGETLKIATVSPGGSATVRILKSAGKEIELLTEGRVNLKFYPGGVMGDDWSVLRKMRIGALHGAVMTTGVFNQIYTDVQVYNLPMQFRNLEEVDYVRDQLDPVLIDGLADSGFVSFGLVEVGMAYAMSTTKAHSVREGRRLKVWTPQGDPAAAKAISAFDISPIPLTIADVLAGLQTGLIDTVTTPPVGAIALQWHSQLDYVLDLPLMYVYGLFVIQERRFTRLSDDDQQVVRRILSKATKQADELNRQDHDSAWTVLQEQGLELIRPSPTDKADWQSHADAATQRWVDEGFVSRDLYTRFSKHLETYRSSVGE